MRSSGVPLFLTQLSETPRLERRRFEWHRLPLARSPRAGEAWSPEAV